VVEVLLDCTYGGAYAGGAEAIAMEARPKRAALRIIFSVIVVLVLEN
jgi:hypothetical protein